MKEDDRHRIEQIYALFSSRPALWMALRAVSASPHVVLRVSTPFVGVGEAKNIEASTLAASALESGALAYTDRMRHFTCRGEKWRFLRVFDRRIARSDDNPANRFVVYFVQYALKLLKDCMRLSCDDEILCDLYPEFRRYAARMHAIWETLSPSLRAKPLMQLPLDDQVLQFHPNYRVILDAYLACESLS